MIKLNIVNTILSSINILTETVKFTVVHVEEVVSYQSSSFWFSTAEVLCF